VCTPAGRVPLSARAFYARVLSTSALAVLLAFALSPAHPPAHLPLVAATALGLAAGTALFLLVSPRSPVFARPRAAAPVLVGKQLFFGLCAFNEEVLWRRILLGEVLPAGPL